MNGKKPVPRKLGMTDFCMSLRLADKLRAQPRYVYLVMTYRSWKVVDSRVPVTIPGAELIGRYDQRTTADALYADVEYTAREMTIAARAA